MIDFDDPLGLLLGFPDADFDGFADDGNGNNIFGNSGQDTNFDGIPDTPAPQDDGDLITFLPVFSDIAISVRTELEGFEVMIASFGGCGLLAINSATNTATLMMINVTVMLRGFSSSVPRSRLLSPVVAVVNPHAVPVNRSKKTSSRRRVQNEKPPKLP